MAAIKTCSRRKTGRGERLWEDFSLGRRKFIRPTIEREVFVQAHEDPAGDSLPAKQLASQSCRPCKAQPQINLGDWIRQRPLQAHHHSA